MNRSDELDALEQEAQSLDDSNYSNRAVWDLINNMLSTLRQQEEVLNKFADDTRAAQQRDVETFAENMRLREAAQDLYDNRLGWSDGRNPYAPPEFWERLRKALETVEDE